MGTTVGSGLGSAIGLLAGLETLAILRPDKTYVGVLSPICEPVYTLDEFLRRETIRAEIDLARPGEKGARIRATSHAATQNYQFSGILRDHLRSRWP
jgi:hypothetical protein